MKNFRNNSEVLNWHSSGSMMGSHAVLLHPFLDRESCICPVHLPVSRRVAICVIGSAVVPGTAALSFRKPLFYLIMVPKCKGSDAGRDYYIVIILQWSTPCD